MLVVRALLISASSLAGIALVVLLVSLITGGTTTPISYTLAAAFVIASAWTYLSLKDRHERTNKASDAPDQVGLEQPLEKN